MFTAYCLKPLHMAGPQSSSPGMLSLLPPSLGPHKPETLRLHPQAFRCPTGSAVHSQSSAPSLSRHFWKSKMFTSICPAWSLRASSPRS